MAIEVFNRHEHKYMTDKKTFFRLADALEKHMELDAYNKDRRFYSISNIYYDTPDDRLIRNSLAKPIYKEKLRLRSYGTPKADSKVFLEIKKKYNGIVNKRRTALTLVEAYNFLNFGIPPVLKEYMNEQVLRELEYFLKIYDLSPKLCLSYDRMAFFERGNDDLRISFDTNIRSRRTDLALEHGDYGIPLLPPNTYLMEVKTSLAKPLWLTKLLSKYGIYRISFSKYGTEFKNTLVSAEEKAAI